MRLMKSEPMKNKTKIVLGDSKETIIDSGDNSVHFIFIAIPFAVGKFILLNLISSILWHPQHKN